jgi:hypothetical protein
MSSRNSPFRWASSMRARFAGELLLPLLDARAEGRVGAYAPEQLEGDGESGRVELHDLAHHRLEAVADPHLRHARVVTYRELDEELLLRQPGGHPSTQEGEDHDRRDDRRVRVRRVRRQVRIAGLFYSALGAGALAASLAAVLFVKRFPPLRLAAVGVLAFSIPLRVLPFLPPWPVVFAALFLATFFTPLINGPTLAVLTARTPPDLRAKVMTAVITVNTLAAPVGYLIAGQVLERWGIVPLFTAVVIGVTFSAILFGGITWRFDDREPAGELVVT